jgi:DNA-binding IclR family transcriptional regulator
MINRQRKRDILHLLTKHPTTMYQVAYKMQITRANARVLMNDMYHAGKIQQCGTMMTYNYMVPQRHKLWRST